MTPDPYPSVQGTFWLAGSPESYRPGRYGQAPDTRVELDGPLFGDGDVIHGRADETGELWTFLASYEEQVHPSRFGSDGSRWTYRAFNAIGGAHLTADATFDRMRLHFQGIDAWAFGVASGSTSPLSDGGQLAVVDDAGVRWLEITAVSPRPYRDLDVAFLMPLRSLLAVATGSACPLIQTQVGEGASLSWLAVLSSGDEPSWEPLKRHAVMVSLQELTLAGAVRWLRLVPTLSPTPHMVAAAIRREEAMLLETETLIMTTVAEGLHNALFPNARKILQPSGREVTDDEAAAARKAAVEAVDPALRNDVAGLVGILASPSFKQRMLELAEAAEQVVPGITGDTKQWAKAVGNVRNHYAHLKHLGVLTEKVFDPSVAVNLSLQWIAAVLLLREIGVDPEVLRRNVNRSGRYSFYLANMRECLPAVFPPLERKS